MCEQRCRTVGPPGQQEPAPQPDTGAYVRIACHQVQRAKQPQRNRCFERHEHKQAAKRGCQPLPAAQLRENGEVVPEDGYIDLGRPIRDYLLLDLPINLVCKPDCKGICVECGVNLNRETCEHTDSRIIFD